MKITKLRRQFDKLAVRYLVVGGSVYVFELTVILIAQHHGASPVVAVAWSFVLGSVISFVLQKLVTFGDKRLHHHIIVPQFMAVGLLVLFNFGFTLLVTKLLTPILSAVDSRTLALLTTAVWNFYIYRTRIFKNFAEKALKDRLQYSDTKKIIVPKSSKNYTLWCWPVVLSLLAQRYRVQSAAIGKRFNSSRKLQLGYVVFGFGVLLASSLVWSYLGARLQQLNADQLADPLLFGDRTVFHGAAFPAQHTFLLKWPLFYLIKLAGYSQLSFIIMTMLVAVATVALFAYLLYRIDRRPLQFGTLCLALASCLLLVPAQPYAGALLPANMAMMTTRNLEYIVYIFGLVFIARQPKVTSWRFWMAVLTLGLVCASDRLFLDLTVCGAAAAMMVYGLRQRWKLVSLSVNWLLASLLAGAVALAALWVITAVQATHIVGQTGASPYAVVHSVKGLVLAAIYGASDLLTNFGANPAFDGTVLRQIPELLRHRLLSISGLSFVLNGAVLLYGLLACYRVLQAGLVKGVKGKGHAAIIKPGSSLRLASMMIWSSLAAVAAFVLANHDYAVDSRYLTICLFAVFIALATYSSQKRLQAERLLLVGAVLCVGMVAAIPQVLQTHRAGSHALAALSSRNQLVAQALKTHHSTTLVGDYWRVLPIETSGATGITVLPLQNCTEPRTVLTSQAWQPNLLNHPFAYLLSFDKGLTDYPACNLQQVTGYYGRPNATELIAGTLAKPAELLLFYDQGLQMPTTVTQTSTIFPITLDALPAPACQVSSVMNIVAHEDDDLLFMNPDILQDIQAGDCVRTVYMTAGDAGQGHQYWLARERATEAAYSRMAGLKITWIRRVVYLANHQYVTVVNPLGNHRLSLIFMRLPDGGLRGQGFASTHGESLHRLYDNTINALHTVDGQSVYNSKQLVSALSQLLLTYQPAMIRTQSNFPGKEFPDHSDHQAVNLFTQQAYAIYKNQQYGGRIMAPIRYYIGYPIRQLPPNLSKTDRVQKRAVFLEYAQYDSGVCRSTEQCKHTPTYGAYLQREYQNPE